MLAVCSCSAASWSSSGTTSCAPATGTDSHSPRSGRKGSGGRECFGSRDSGAQTRVSVPHRFGQWPGFSGTPIKCTDKSVCATSLRPVAGLFRKANQVHRQECLCHIVLARGRAFQENQNQCGTDTLVCALNFPHEPDQRSSAWSRAV